MKSVVNEQLYLLSIILENDSLSLQGTTIGKDNDSG
jgi:hypothetical protein